MNDAITVTKGNLTDEELGALVTVLAELTRPSPNAYVPDDRPIAFGWKSYWRTIREPFMPGPVSYTHLTLPTNREV